VRTQVVIQGEDIRRYQLKSLRDQMSFVLQDTLLFRTTIWENIAYGKPGASLKQIRRAAELANAHEFIDAMPDGCDTMVGQPPKSLSICSSRDPGAVELRRTRHRHREGLASRVDVSFKRGPFTGRRKDPVRPGNSRAAIEGLCCSEPFLPL
jgi:hypothetical protein